MKGSTTPKPFTTESKSLRVIEFRSSGVKRFKDSNSLTLKLPKLLNCLLIFSLCLCVSVVCCGFAVSEDGYVIVATDKQTLINLGRADSISEADVFGVFRDGKHIGSVIIDSVKESYSVCRILKMRGVEVFLKGDTVVKEERQEYIGAEYSHRLNFDKKDGAKRMLQPYRAKTSADGIEVDLDGDGKKEKVKLTPELNYSKRLMVLDEKGRPLWESSVSFGRDENIDIISSDLDKDGRQEIFVARNIISYGRLSRFLPFELEGLKRYKGCYIYRFQWDGKELVPKWRTKKLQGYITSLTLIDEGGRKELSASVVWDGKEGPKSSVLFYKL